MSAAAVSVLQETEVWGGVLQQLGYQTKKATVKKFGLHRYAQQRLTKRIPADATTVSSVRQNISLRKPVT